MPAPLITLCSTMAAFLRIAGTSAKSTQICWTASLQLVR